MTSVQEIIQPNLKLLLDDWVLKVRNSIPIARDLSEPELLGYMPEFLKAIEASPEHQNKISEAYGNHRAGIPGYNLVDVITEYEIMADILQYAIPIYLRPPIKDTLFSGIRGACRAFSTSQTMSLESRLQLAIEGSGVGFFDLDLRTNEVNWTKEEAELFGFPPDLVHLNAKQVYDRIDPVDLERNTIFSASPPTEYKEEFRITLPNGNLRWLLGIGKYHKDENGKAFRLSGANIDVTDKKIAITELLEEKELRDKFTSALTHDLKNPLTAAQLQLRKGIDSINEPETLKDSLDKVRVSLDRMETLVDDLLDASRFQAGYSMYLDMVLCDLVPMIRKTVEALDSTSRVRLDLPGSMDGLWNIRGLHRVVENLVSNALKYSPPDSVVTLTGKNTDEVALISVHNEGEPIEAHERHLLFKMFGRTKSSEGKTSGWGIGLTIVKGIIDIHRGKITVESDRERGTTFQVSLPYFTD